MNFRCKEHHGSRELDQLAEGGIWFPVSQTGLLVKYLSFDFIWSKVHFTSMWINFYKFKQNDVCFIQNSLIFLILHYFPWKYMYRLIVTLIRWLKCSTFLLTWLGYLRILIIKTRKFSYLTEWLPSSIEPSLQDWESAATFLPARRCTHPRVPESCEEIPDHL